MILIETNQEYLLYIGRMSNICKQYQFEGKKKRRHNLGEARPRCPVDGPRESHGSGQHLRPFFGRGDPAESGKKK